MSSIHQPEPRWILIFLIILVGCGGGCSSGGSSATEVRIIAPESGIFSGAAAITVKGELNNISATEVHVVINGNDLIADLTDSSRFQCSVVLQEGTNIIQAYAVTASGSKIESAEQKIIYDTQPPVLTFTNLQDQSRINQETMTLEVSVWEASGIASAALKVNGGEIPGAEFSAEGILTAPVSFTPGWNTISLTATDLSGYTGQAEIDVYYDTRVPTLSLISPQPEAVVAVGAFTIQAQVDQYHIESADLVFDGGNYTVPVVYREIFLDVELTYGVHTFSISVTDDIGNTASTGVITFYAGYDAMAAAALKDALLGGDNVLVLDVRAAEKYSEGHIDGALNIPLDVLENNLSAVKSAAADKIIVYGDVASSGDDLSFEEKYFAESALALLYRNGMMEIYFLSGGLAAWKEEVPVTLTPEGTVTVKVGVPYQFHAFGGLAPYRWTVCNESYGTIDANGLYVAAVAGHCVVYLHDADDVRDETQIIMEN